MAFSVKSVTTRSGLEKMLWNAILSVILRGPGDFHDGSCIIVAFHN